jgi:hypothetical protein
MMPFLTIEQHQPPPVVRRPAPPRYGTRRRIIDRLERGPATVSEIAIALNATTPTEYQRVSAMVGYLRDSRVVRWKREIRLSPVSKRVYRCFVYRLPAGHR